MLKEKKGWILIVEAVIAVLILFGFLFTAISKQAQQTQNVDSEDFFYDVVSEMVLFAEKDDLIRESVINGDCELIYILDMPDKKTTFTQTTIENIKNRNKLLKLEGGKEAFEKRECKYGLKKQ